MDYASALQYTGNAPRIIAQGQGKLAQAIVDLAHEHGIEIYQDLELSRSLSMLETGNEIPEGLYAAVAIVFAHCYQVNSRVRDDVDSRGVQ